MNRQFVLLLILVSTASSLLFAEPAHSSIPKPSVPEFTLEFNDHTYYVPPTYGIDTYTGENVTIKGNYFIENKSIIVTIENQPFDYSVDDTNYYLFYNVRFRGHFGEEWTELYSEQDFPDNLLAKSNSTYTVLSIPTWRAPYGAKFDVQANAYLGHDSQVYVPPSGQFFVPPFVGYYKEVSSMDGTSGWTKTQTITLSAPESTTPEMPEQPDQFITILPEALIVIAVAASIGIAIYTIKRKQS